MKEYAGEIVFILFVFLNIFVYLVVNSISKEDFKDRKSGYSIKILLQKWSLIIILLEICILNIIFAFIPINMPMYKAYYAAVGIFGLFYFIIDFLIKEKNVDYIIYLQNKIGSFKRVDELFEISHSFANLAEYQEDENEQFRLMRINNSNKKGLVFEINKKQYNMISINNMTENEIKHIKKQINIHLDNLKDIEDLKKYELIMLNEEIYDKYLNRIEHRKENIITTYKKYREEKKNKKEKFVEKK